MFIVSAKEPCTFENPPHISAQKPNTSAKETYISVKELYHTVTAHTNVHSIRKRALHILKRELNISEKVSFGSAKQPHISAKKVLNKVCILYSADTHAHTHTLSL